MPKNAGIAISAGIAIFFSGCDNSTAQLATSSFDSDEAAPLVATIASIDRGSVHVGSIVEQAFVLRAWDKGPVKVKSSVTNCCSGNGLIPDLTGQVLDPGSETLVSLKLYGAAVGRESVSAKIYCEGREVPIEIALSVTTPRSL